MEPGRLQRFARFVFQRDGFAPDVSGMLNALAEAAQDELIPCPRQYGIDVVIYNPIAGGVLSGPSRDEGAWFNACGDCASMGCPPFRSKSNARRRCDYRRKLPRAIRLKDLKKGPLPLPVVKALDQAWQHANAVAPTYWRQSSWCPILFDMYTPHYAIGHCRSYE